MKEHTEKHISIWQRIRQGKRQTAADGELEKDLQQLWDWSADYGSSFEADTEAGLQRLHRKLGTDTSKKNTVVRSMGRTFMRYAAAVAFLLLAATAVYWYLSPGQSATAEWSSVKTGPDATQTVVLPDGSEIVLNANTTLTYRSDMAKAPQRLVELSGEAYFSVQRRPEQAFIITMEKAEVEVLGTSFNLRAYPNEDFTEVEVATGKVAFRSRTKAKELILIAEEAAMLDASDEMIRIEAPHLNRQAWRTHRLYFKDMELAKAAPLIERYFNVQFEWEEGAANCPLTGDWQSESIADVIAVIEALTGLQVQQLTADSYRLAGRCN